MNQYLKRSFTVVEVLVVVAIVGLLMACTGFVFPVEFLFYLCFGWILFLYRVLPQVDVDGSAVLLSCLALALFVLGSHWLLRSLRLPTATLPQWRLRWTLSAAAIVLLMFVAGISFVGVTHQFAWMVTANEPMLSNGSEAYHRFMAGNRVKQIGLSLQNYDDMERTLPPGVSIDAEGRSLHSWMTLILPYIEQRQLYDQILLDRRWDDPQQNAEVFAKVVREYQSPVLAREKPVDAQNRALTHFSANKHVLSGTGKRSMADIPDGISNTILAGEAAGNYVAWGQPGNWRDPARGLNQSPDGFGSRNKSGVMFSFADGSVRRIGAETSPEVLKALATPAGGEVVSENDY